MDNLTNSTKKNIVDEFEQERVRYQKEKTIILKKLEKRVKNNVKLKLDLCAANEKYKRLENSMSEVILILNPSRTINYLRMISLNRRKLQV